MNNNLTPEVQVTREVDFSVYNGGSVFLLTPLTQEADAWVEKHIPEDAMHMGNGIAVEHRYILDIIEGIKDEGLIIR